MQCLQGGVGGSCGGASFYTSSSISSKIVNICFVLTAGAPSIRDVIAFPKTTTGQCLLTEAPSGVSDAQLADLHIAKAGRRRLWRGRGNRCAISAGSAAANLNSGSSYPCLPYCTCWQAHQEGAIEASTRNDA
jgi:hypothetical protein